MVGQLTVRFTVSLGQQNYRREMEKWIEKRNYKSPFLLVLSGDLETRRSVMAPLGCRIEATPTEDSPIPMRTRRDCGFWARKAATERRRRKLGD
ncbi:hypothetical protein U1Q18_015666 [Sarracenia purpurea var. burkii]